MNMVRFSVAYWCVLVAVLLPLACSWLAKWGMAGNRKKTFHPQRSPLWIVRVGHRHTRPAARWRQRSVLRPHRTFGD